MRRRFRRAEDSAANHPRATLRRCRETMSCDDALLSAVDDHRQHVLGIVEGLSEALLRAPCAPSRWCPLGMIFHLAASERYRLHCMFAGRPADFHGHQTSALDLRGVSARDSVEDVLRLDRHQIEESNVLVRSNSLNSPIRAHDPRGETGTSRTSASWSSRYSVTRRGTRGTSTSHGSSSTDVSRWFWPPPISKFGVAEP